MNNRYNNYNKNNATSWNQPQYHNNHNQPTAGAAASANPYIRAIAGRLTTSYSSPPWGNPTWQGQNPYSQVWQNDKVRRNAIYALYPPAEIELFNQVRQEVFFTPSLPERLNNQARQNEIYELPSLPEKREHNWQANQTSGNEMEASPSLPERRNNKARRDEIYKPPSLPQKRQDRKRKAEWPDERSPGR